MTQKEMLLNELSGGAQDRNLLICKVADECGVEITSVRRRLNELVSERRVCYEDANGVMCAVLLADNDISGLERENQRLNQELTRLVKSREPMLNDFSGKTVRFGALGDTQLGSRFENLTLLNAAYETFVAEGIDTVYHTGDLLEGEKLYRGQEYEIHIHGCDDQITYCVAEYPKVKGIQTHFIIGNHDGSFWKRSGIDIGLRIAAARPDMTYLGAEEADVKIQSDTGEALLRLHHPHKGTSYALSYNSQKYIESLTGGHKPNIIFTGHYHKMEMLFYRNVHLCQTGCMQHQTPFMRGRNIAAMQGFWIVELVLNEGGIARCKAEWFPCYD